jgi:hypothetical protein
MPNCAVFYAKWLDEILSFDGEEFGGLNEIQFKVIPQHHEENLPQTKKLCNNNVNPARHQGLKNSE